MSDEEESKIEKTFIDELGAKYPMAKINASDTQEYGISFYPSVFCIDADGNMHSVPEDRMPREAAILALLKGVAPVLPEESRYDPLRVMLKKKQHSKAGAYLAKMLAADKLDAAMRSVFVDQQALLVRRARIRAGRVAKLGSGPDYFLAKTKLRMIQKRWAGFEAADAAKAELARFAEDSVIKKELAASKALHKLTAKYDAGKVSQRRKLKAGLGKFFKKYEGTHAAAQAGKKLARLR